MSGQLDSPDQHCRQEYEHENVEAVEEHPLLEQDRCVGDERDQDDGQGDEEKDGELELVAGAVATNDLLLEERGKVL